MSNLTKTYDAEIPCLRPISNGVKRIIVAMSGGVDSSVAAALLKKDGFDVEGAFMRLSDLPSSKEAEKRAKKIAKILGVRIHIFNFKKEFKKKIIDCFLKEYKAGRTPNPCVYCNKEIKFGIFLKKAQSLNADYIATGHYARLIQKGRNLKLLSARDKEKDQSYFLWRLNQKQLKHILFPIGGHTKSQIRNLAKKLKLPVFDVRDSQEICFVQDTVNDFLKSHLKPNPGKIIDINGGLIGFHQGLHFYTIGQRKGIGLAGGPYWVSAKDLKKNALIVAKNEKYLYGKELIVKNVNWISGKPSSLPLKIKIKIRYRHQPSGAVITEKIKTKYKIVFNKPQRAVTSGQSAVFYEGQELLGGGIIG